ncbi:AraC family transcriptional regulator [Blautia wexlerae]|uniref:AraC family transcriptional regulator n=1 Tax=Blautia wexlerae TaxID=418240 RepID=A0ABX2GQ50_9FIRM|nr:AraC family transcriptional regulator [Blautia wexlerae]NSF74278.1 AraC family transcriptional regulator [Blautia wexlerae]
MKSKEISHEIIDVPVDTNVKFRTSTDPGSYIPMHWHRAVEIIYIQEGSLDVTVESESFTIQTGDCIVINGNVLHSTKCTSPNTAILLQIPLDFMEKYIPDLGQLIFLFDFRTKDQRQQTKQAMFKTILEQLQIINDVHPDGYLLRFNSLIFELLFQLYHNFAVKILQSNTSQKKKDIARLEPVLDYISEHYREPISLNEIAEVACLQTGYFCRFFKKKMGITFLEYQNEYRLSFIYRDLITTRDPVQVILERHGFTNYKLFRRMFLEHFGNTPTQIRKQREIL